MTNVSECLVKKEQTSFRGRLKALSLPVLALFFILLPACMYGAVSLFYYCKTGNTPLPMPQWNDEAAYYELIKTWLGTGASKGYWGFSGGHAILGTGGAWSPAILFPYALWGMMFGWSYSSVAVANVVFLCIVNALVLLILKPDHEGIFRLLLLEILSSHLWLYMNTIMSEVLRYGLGILLAAMLLRLLFEEEKNISKLFAYVIVPIYILITTQIYIFFAFAIPVYVFAIMKNKKWWKKVVVSFFSMAVVAGGSYYLLHLISSNYNIYKTEILLETLQKKDVMGAIRTFLWMFKVGVLDLWNCFRSMTGHGMFRWFVAFLGIMVIVPLVYLVLSWLKSVKGKKEDSLRKSALGKDSNSVQRSDLEQSGDWKKNIGPDFWGKDRQICLAVAYSIAIFVFMYITVYSLEAFTFYRGLGIVVLFSLVFVAQMTDRKWYIAGLICYAIGMLYVPKNMADFNTERYVTTETRKEWDDLAEQLGNTMVLTVEDGIDSVAGKATEESTGLKAGNTLEERRWENTAVLYTMEPKLICSIPAGFGVNFAMYSDEIVTDAGYLVFSLEKDENLRGDWLEQSHESIYLQNRELLDNEYYIQYVDEDYVIYKKYI